MSSHGMTFFQEIYGGRPHYNTPWRILKYHKWLWSNIDWICNFFHCCYTLVVLQEYFLLLWRGWPLSLSRVLIGCRPKLVFVKRERGIDRSFAQPGKVMLRWVRCLKKGILSLCCAFPRVRLYVLYGFTSHAISTSYAFVLTFEGQQ